MDTHDSTESEDILHTSNVGVNLDNYIASANPAPDDFNITYKPDCVQKLGNFASPDSRYLFEYAGEDREHLNWDRVKHISPKLHKILEEIRTQDAEDMRTHGRKFKHFIFSNVKSGTHGAKIIATALIDIFGMRLGYNAAKHKRVLKKDNPWGKITLTDPDATKGENFYLLSSVGVYKQPIPVPMRKEILRRFNSRPDNVYGDVARIIIMDAGFKEGIDLFDIKYVHIFEPQSTMADQKQVIGRGTRTCGQKGLDFHPTKGWPLHVNIYDLEFPEETAFKFNDARTVHELYLKSMGIDLRMLNLVSDMERVYTEAAIDADLNRNLHEFSTVKGGAAKCATDIVGDDIQEQCAKALIGLDLPYDKEESQDIINRRFADLKWEKPEMKNMCGGGDPDMEQFLAKDVQRGGDKDNVTGGASIINYNNTQNFISQYFTPALNRKGVLLSHSVGTGKTCSAIAAATSSFEKDGYTILWVTRTTLKNDIWKNMFDQICSASIAKAYKDGVISDADLAGPKRMKLLSKAWAIRPMSYKQFSNLVSGKNALYKALVKRNGFIDPLRKTLLIIDEAHKLYGDSDLSSIEQPDMNVLYESLMRSYEVSGEDSARLMIMTATPITKSPMELVQLLNLCRERHMRLPDDFNVFASTYLDERGLFTKAGETKFSNDIAGHVSYLNRERDARVFSQPIVELIKVPILNEAPLYESYDARLVRGIDNDKLIKAKQAIEDIALVTQSVPKVVKNTVVSLKTICDAEEEPRLQKLCKKTARKTLSKIREAAKTQKAELSEKVKSMREDMKNLRNSIKSKVENVKNMQAEREKFYKNMYGSDSDKSSSDDSSDENSSSESSKSNKSNKSSKSSKSLEGGQSSSDSYKSPPSLYFEDFKKPIIGLNDPYQQYKQSVFYNVMKKCKVPPKRQVFDNYPVIVQKKEVINSLTNAIIEDKKNYAQTRKNMGLKIKQMKQKMVAEKNALEKAQIKAQIKQEQKTTKRQLRLIRSQMSLTMKNRKSEIKSHLATIKKMKKKLEKAFRKAQTQKRKEEKALHKEQAVVDMQSTELITDAQKFSKTMIEEQNKLMHQINENMAEFNEEYNEEKAEIEHLVKAKEEMDKAMAIAKEEKAKAKEEKQKEREEKQKAREEKQKERAEKKNKSPKNKSPKSPKSPKNKLQRAPCPKGTKRYAPVGPDCYTQEYIEAWQSARRDQSARKDQRANK